MPSYIIPESIASEEVFGEYIDSHESSILSEEVFGIPHVIQDSFILVFSSIKSEEVFGGDYFECQGLGILSDEAFGIPNFVKIITNQEQENEPIGTDFGIPTIILPTSASGIPSEEQFDSPWIVNHGVVAREIVRISGRNYKFIVFRRRK